MYKPNFQKREVLVFRQFQRKGYSLFACLGREVVISVLSVATLSSTKAAGISDETWRVDSDLVTKEVWLGDVGVTGSRAPLTKSQAARMVTVLTRDDIAQAPVQSVNDLLKMAVGIDVRQRGALGSQTDISIRGGTQEQIIVLLNGINICDPQTGHNVLDLPVQLSEIVRIEVLEGPAGRAYGTSSLVGAINIVTHPDARNGADAELEGGSFGYAKAGMVARLASSSHLSQSLSGSYSRSDGYSRSKAGSLNTDYRGMKGFYQGKYDDEQVCASWHFGLATKGWGSSTFYATPRWQADDQYEHTTKLMSALQAETKQGALRLRPSVYWQQHRDRYEGYRGKPDAMPYNYNRCNVYGIGLNSWFDWTFGRTAIGAELRNEDLVSSNLGEPLSQPVHIGGTDRDYTRGINRTNVSAHIEHNILLPRLTLSAGLIAAKSSWGKGGWGVYPGVDARFNVYRSPLSPTSLPLSPTPCPSRGEGSLNSSATSDSSRKSNQAPLPSGGVGGGFNVYLFASWNTSLRLPSFTEMYYKLQGYAADPLLKPEEMQAIEIGGALAAPAVEAKVAFYHHHGKNMIDWIMDTTAGADAVWQSVNHTKINAYGLESSLRLDVGQLFPSSPLENVQVSYSHQRQDKQQTPHVVSQYALEYLRNKLVVTAALRLFRSLHIGLCYRWQDRVGTFTDFDSTVRSYKPFSLVDVRMTWQQPRYSLYAKVNNLLDNRHYTDYGNVPQPGIWIVAGVTVKI